MGAFDIEITALRSPDHLVNSLDRLDGVTEPVDCLATTSPEFINVELGLACAESLSANC